MVDLDDEEELDIAGSSESANHSSHMPTTGRISIRQSDKDDFANLEVRSGEHLEKAFTTHWFIY